VIRLERSYRIARPPAAVFAVLTDPERLAEWQKGTVEVERLTPGPMGVGTRLREVHAAMGRKLESVVEVTEFEPDRVFALHVVEGVPVDGRWELTANGDGTRLAFTATGDPPGPGPVVGFVLKRQFDAHHKRLRELLER
jgi:uncharacterized protein YndB with AHSA1/START domain